jgi:hypothetical protein
MKINLTQSLSIFDSANIKFIENADIKIYENEQYKELLSYIGNGNYLSSFRPSGNTNYKIIVSSTLGQSVAENYIPQKTTILSIDTTSVYVYSQKELECRIKFKDDEASENFYLLDIRAIAGSYSFGMNDNRDTIYYEQSIDFEYDKSIIEEKIGNNTISYGVIFSDKFFNGKEIELAVKIGSDILQIKDKNSIKFYLKSISRDYYLYAKSYSRSINQAEDVLGEPIQVYSNIQNGFGIFGGYNQDVDSIEYERF